MIDQSQIVFWYEVISWGLFIGLGALGAMALGAWLFGR